MRFKGVKCMKKRGFILFTIILGLTVLLIGCNDSNNVKNTDDSWQRKQYEVVYENYDELFNSKINGTNEEQNTEEQNVEEQISEEQPAEEPLAEEPIIEELPVEEQSEVIQPEEKEAE